MRATSIVMLIVALSSVAFRPTSGQQHRFCSVYAANCEEVRHEFSCYPISAYSTTSRTKWMDTT